MSIVSSLWNDVISYLHGKKPLSAINADATKLLQAVEKVAAGIGGASKDVPGLAADVGTMIAEGAALVASKGIDLPVLAEVASTVQKTLADFQRAVSDYKTAAAIVSIIPAEVKPPVVTPPTPVK